MLARCHTANVRDRFHAHAGRICDGDQRHSMKMRANECHHAYNARVLPNMLHPRQHRSAPLYRPNIKIWIALSSISYVTYPICAFLFRFFAQFNMLCGGISSISRPIDLAKPEGYMKTIHNSHKWISAVRFPITCNAGQF